MSVAAMSYVVMTAGAVVAAAEDDFVESPFKPGAGILGNAVIVGRGGVEVRQVHVIQVQGPVQLANVKVVQRVKMNLPQNSFDQMLFGMDLKTARLMLEGQVERKVREVSNRYQLSTEKRNKLTMLARADLFRVLHDAERLRQRYERSQDDSNEIIAVQREVAVLRQRQRDLLGPDSFFAKSAKPLLEHETIAPQYSGLDDSQYQRHLSNVESAIRELERVVDLRQAQKDRLIDLLLKECRPPRVFGDFDDTVLKYRLATTPEDTLKSILDEDQWPKVRNVLHGFLEYRPLLLRHGLIDRNF